MRGNARLAILLIISMLLILTMGCAKKVEGSDDKTEEQPVETDSGEESDGTVVLKLWSWYSYQGIIDSFEEEHEGIMVEEELFPFDKCEEEYMRAITSGEGPDVLIFDSSFFGHFTASGILQDLLKAPCSAGKYENDFIGWESGFSMDNNELISLTVTTAPYVALYRADIMEKYGFPHEPEEFGEFIKNPENVLEIARTLKKDDMYIFQYPTDLTDLTGATLGFFDKDFKYNRFGDLFKLSLDMAKETHQNDLEARANFWGEDGKEAIKQNKLVMVTLASYAMLTLRNIAPEQSGLWRVTTPPLGLAAWASDSRIGINNQSKHKKEAWSLVEYIATHKGTGGAAFDVVPGYKKVHGYGHNMNREEDYFGNQIVYPMLEELAINMYQYRLTPFDSQALQMYRDGVWRAASDSLPSEVHIDKMKKDIEESVELMNK